MSEIKYNEVPPLKTFAPFKFPIRNNTYEIRAGLNSISKDDIFINDDNVDLYLKEKQKCLQEDADKYFCYDQNYSEDLKFITKKLNQSECFHSYSLTKQQDFAVVKILEDKNINIAISLSFPNHWDPREKIGKDFIITHRPVADFDKINKNNQLLMKNILNKGPFERYAWGLSTDTRLNHHPEAPKNYSKQQWYGRSLDDSLYMRIERQSFQGFVEVSSVLFTIHTFFVNVESLEQEKIKALLGAINSMSEATLKYKGINKEKICQKLESIKTSRS